MSEPATTAAVGTADSWATESACDITSAVRGKWQNPGNQNQVPAPITCRDTVTDVIWTEAVQTNYQQWSSPWTGPRLWIGNSHNGAPSYHGDYVAGGLTTWKSSNSTPGVYSGLTANSGNTGDTAAFWLR